MIAWPDWLEPLPDAEQQRATDEWAIETCGIPGVELMERAGAGLAELVSARVPEGRVVVVSARATTVATGSWWRVGCATRAATSTFFWWPPAKTFAGTRRPTSSGCPARRHGRLRLAG